MAIDDRIPFIPGLWCIYGMWFPLIALFPLYYYFYSQPYYTIYQLSIIVSIITSTVLYLLFPTCFERPEPEDGPWSGMIKLIHRLNFKGTNCSPSLHCTQCFIIAATIIMGGARQPGDLVFIMIVCLTIVASTVLIKQHALIDVITAIPLASFSLAAGWLITHHFGYEAILRMVGLI